VIIHIHVLQLLYYWSRNVGYIVDEWDNTACVTTSVRHSSNNDTWHVFSCETYNEYNRTTRLVDAHWWSSRNKYYTNTYIHMYAFLSGNDWETDIHTFLVQRTKNNVCFVAVSYPIVNYSVYVHLLTFQHKYCTVPIDITAGNCRWFSFCLLLLRTIIFPLCSHNKSFSEATVIID